MSDQTKNINFFYLGESLDYPIYLKIDDGGFSEESLDMILQFGFKALDNSSIEGVEAMMKENKGSRILSVSSASPGVERQISRIQESDLYGFESIIPQNGYNVYRYKQGGVLVFSSTANIWRLGFWTNFSDRNSLEKAYNVILNRYLSWSFMVHGVVGFWGRISGKEIEVLKQKESKGEAVYIDTEKNIVFNCKDQPLPVRGMDIVMEEGRNSSLNKSRMASKEELVSLLCSSCTYFDLKGLNIKIRQMITKIAKTQCGYIKPKTLEGSARGLSL